MDANCYISAQPSITWSFNGFGTRERFLPLRELIGLRRAMPIEMAPRLHRRSWDHRRQSGTSVCHLDGISVHCPSVIRENQNATVVYF